MMTQRPGFELSGFVHLAGTPQSIGDQALNDNFRRLRRLFGGVVLAEDYGVSPDSEDNTEAIQDALDAAADLGCTEVLLPAGRLAVCTSASSPTISVPAGVALRGRGMDVTILEVGVIDGARSGWSQVTVPAGAFRVAIRTADGSSRVSIEDLTINGQGPLQTGTQLTSRVALLAIAGTTGAAVRRVRADDAWNGLLPPGGGRAANILVADASDVEIVDCRADGSGYELIGMRGTCVNVRVIGGVYGQSRVHGICPQPGSVDVLIQGVYVVNDHDYAASTTFHPDAVCCHNAHNVTILGCYLSVGEGAGRPLHIIDGSTNVQVIGCTIEGSPNMQDIGGNAVVHVDGQEGSSRGVWDLLISGCRIVTKHTTRSCIAIDGGNIHGYTISGCRLEATAGARVLYLVRNTGAKCTDLRILNNTISTTGYLAAEVWSTPGIEGFQFCNNRVSITPSAGAGSNPQAGLAIGNASGSDSIVDVLIAGNTFELLADGGEVDGIRLRKASDVRVTDNRIRVGTTGDAVEILGDVTGAIVRGNSVGVRGSSSASTGVTISGTGNANVLVDGNDFSAVDEAIDDTDTVATVGTNL